jgi:hypothetical protein
VPLANGLRQGDTSRHKILTHDMRDNTRWKDGTNTHPDLFVVWDGDGNAGTEISVFSIELVEVTNNNKLTNYLIVNFSRQNNSWSHNYDETIGISLFDKQGTLLFRHIASFPVGRTSCNYGGGDKGHHELQISPSSLYDSVDEYQLAVPTISGPIGQC